MFVHGTVFHFQRKKKVLPRCRVCWISQQGIGRSWLKNLLKKSSKTHQLKGRSTKGWWEILSFYQAV